MKPSEEILKMVHAFSDEDRKEAVRTIVRHLRKLEAFAEDCRDNWDCDSDGHRYRTGCRCCEAKQIMEDIGNETKDTAPSEAERND